MIFSFFREIHQRVDSRASRLWHWIGWAFSGERLVVLGGLLLMAVIFGRSLGLMRWIAPRAPDSGKSFQQITVGATRLEVEVARTPAEIEQGLSDRTEIGSDGMLFLFDSPRMTTFWMLRMQFALDMIWMREGKIVKISNDIAPPSQTEGIPEVVSSEQEVDAVLEVPAGTAAKNGWRVGDSWQVISSQP